MTLAVSDFIAGDLDEIAAYIALDSPRRAVSFIREIHATFTDIQRNPLLYPLRPDIGETARLATHDDRYSILFQVIGEAVRIERVAGDAATFST